jgi:hypothetical protein
VTALTLALHFVVMALTAVVGELRRLRRMEWMLQVVDELDDVVGTLRHLMLAWRVEISKLAAAAVTTAQREVRFTFAK